MPFRLRSARNGYEAIEYKAFAPYSVKCPPEPEKTIANCRKSAHATPMSKQTDVVVRRYAGPWT
jgi:hypothetical protein